MSDSSKRSARPPRAADPRPVTLADLEEARALCTQLDVAAFDEANDPDAWLFERETQDLIDTITTEAAAPFEELLPAGGAEMLRREVALACHTDETAIEYLRRLQARSVPDRSGKVKRSAFRAAPVVPLRPKKAGGESS